MSDTPETPKKSPTALREEEVQAFWKEHDIFNKTLAKPSPKGEFVFYDGPPFATGLPHYGSLLSSVIKDVIPRYKTMQGYHVPRRWGWDCHGLPIENMIEKKLGLKTKKDIETIGVEKFNAEARAAVMEFAHDWKAYIDRLGRFVDFEGAYKTMDNSYIESVWWGLKQIHDKGRLYEGKRVLMYCPHCETPLAKAEIAQDNSYEDVTEESVIVKFKLQRGQHIAGWEVPDNTFVLAWTTTPWTLPGNVALAVGKDIRYTTLTVKGSDDVYVVASERVEDVFKDQSVRTVNDNLTGSDLEGLSYEPLFTVGAVENSGKKSHYIALADFVGAEEGTGIVHTAVMYGEDDYVLGQKIDLPTVQLLTPNGRFNDDAPELVKGKYFKWHARGSCPIKKGEDAETFIKQDLTSRGLLFAVLNRTHSYPHCYRCGTPLIYNALSSWFINIQDVKNRLLELNENVTWVPEHLKHGRFEYILEGAPDWTISRNRYWASPLPIWKNPATGKVVVIGSVDELRARAKKSGNRYFVMRHGEADSNVAGILSTKVDNPHHLTEKGKTEAVSAGEQLKNEKIDLIVASPFVRTKETAEIVRGILGLSDASVIHDERLHEVHTGVFEGTSVAEYREAMSFAERMHTAPEGGETLDAVGKRMAEVLFELEKTHAGKNILIISHATPLFMLMGYTAFLDQEALIKKRGETAEAPVPFATVNPLPFFPYPHRANFEPDLHRPYIDALELLDDDGTPLARIPEVVDCWLESGSMPFASNHYPFENEQYFDTHFPGDFIAEYIAQTRTWFYYMHAIGAQVFNTEAFKTVVSTGTVLAGDGSKMSKSKGNYTDAFTNFDAFGADALRAYLMGSVVMQSEDLRFLDADLRDTHNRLVSMLWNAYQFFALQRGEEPINLSGEKSTAVLDRWILARTHLLVDEVTHAMDIYDTVKSVRAIKLFVEDFSTWYIRRSRDRLKGDDALDRAGALRTTAEVLLTLSKVVAPILPFIAESIYQGVGGPLESVHLESWPERHSVDEEAIILMAVTRGIVSRALEARASSGLKIRQPLQSATIKDERLREYADYLALIRDELNVKEIHTDGTLTEEVVLDTHLTNELIEEGAVRELIRMLQQSRKDLGMAQSDRARLLIDTNDDGQAFIKRNQKEITRVAGIASIDFVPLTEEAVKTELYGAPVSFALLQ